MGDEEEFFYTSYSAGTAASLRFGGRAVTVTGDEEERGYSSYSSRTAAALRRRTAQQVVAGDEEEYCFPAFRRGAEEEKAAAENTAAQRDEFAAEGFLAEVSVHKLMLATHISERKIKYFLSAVYLVVGVLCVAFTSHIQNYFPYIVGGMTTAFGVGQFIAAIIRREYVHTYSNKTASSLVMIAIGIFIMVEHSSAYTIIAVVWGFLGLMESAHAFNHAFSRMARSKNCIFFLCKGIIEFVLAFLLLYEPSDAHHIYLHIMVFGVQLIFDAFTTFPPIKEFLSRK